VFSDTLIQILSIATAPTVSGFPIWRFAFLRALGIPARYVAGTNFTANYRVPRGDGTFLSFLLNYGAHSWLEVYYPDAGWVPYDGQGYLHHIDVLRYRKCHGTGHKDAHPELYRSYVFCPSEQDTYSFDYENYEWSTIDCFGSVCSVDNLQFVSHDPSYPTTAIVIADSAYAPVGACCVVPGDINDDGRVNMGDAVYLITYIFRGGPEPNCMTTADTNHDCNVNLGDAVYLVNYIGRGGPPPDCDPCKSYRVRG